jgi:hypothetical protein
LLSAITAHLGSDFRHFLLDGMEPRSDTRERVQMVAELMREYVDHTPILTQLLIAEPVFLRSFYNEYFGNLLRMVAGAIANETGMTHGPVSERPDVLAAAEMLVRVAISYRVVEPGNGLVSQDQLVAQLAMLVDSEPTMAVSGKVAPHS